MQKNVLCHFPVPLHFHKRLSFLSSIFITKYVLCMYPLSNCTIPPYIFRIQTQNYSHTDNWHVTACCIQVILLIGSCIFAATRITWEVGILFLKVAIIYITIFAVIHNEYTSAVQHECMIMHRRTRTRNHQCCKSKPVYHIINHGLKTVRSQFLAQPPPPPPKRQDCHTDEIYLHKMQVPPASYRPNSGHLPNTVDMYLLHQCESRSTLSPCQEACPLTQKPSPVHSMTSRRLLSHDVTCSRACWALAILDSPGWQAVRPVTESPFSSRAVPSCAVLGALSSRQPAHFLLGQLSPSQDSHRQQVQLY